MRGELMITRIYIDVDGVINSLSRSAPKQNTQWLGEWKSEYVKVHGSKYMILWSTELIHQLNLLDKRDDVEFIFLTTWQDSATTILAPLTGLNALNWKVLYPEHEDDIYDTKTWWKLTAIKNDLEDMVEDDIDYDQVVWIDDDLQYDKSSLDWAKTQEKDFLLVPPISVLGLTQKQISVIIDFIDGNL